MIKWRSLLVLSFFLALAYCQHVPTQVIHVHKKKHHHHKHHLLYLTSFLSYLTFWLVKIKVIFVLGTLFMLFVFAGKVFALIKYSEYLKYKHHDHHEYHSHGPEKIYLDSSNHNFGGGFGGYSASSPYSEGVTLDHPPPSASGGYGRSMEEKSVYENYETFTKMIPQLNITEVAFKEMGVKTENCKRKFVCEAEFHLNHISILKSATELISDEDYERYKTNEEIEAVEECGELYPCVEKSKD